jgi:uncharacterized protein YbbK (DUF523 family)
LREFAEKLTPFLVMLLTVNTGMEASFDMKPKLGISACLLGQKVRFDGGHKREQFLTDLFGRFVEWIPICPEVEVGMGVPREIVRLVGMTANPRMIAEKSGRDWTSAMNHFAAKRLREIAELNLSGYVFKKNSPSCGMERVRVYSSKGMPERQGRGLFAAALMKQWPLLPVEEEGRLNDLKLRENFIERVFAYHRWQQASAEENRWRRWCGFIRATNICCSHIVNVIIANWVGWWGGRNKDRLAHFTTTTARFLWRRWRFTPPRKPMPMSWII